MMRSVNASKGFAGLYALKPAYARLLAPVLDVLERRNIGPDVVSLIGVVGGLGAAVVIAFAPVGFAAGLAAALLIAVRLASANLDGNLARRTNCSRPMGGLINEVSDKIADLLVLLAVAYHLPPALALFVVFAGCAPSWIAICVAAQGGSRRTVGRSARPNDQS